MQRVFNKCKYIDNTKIYNFKEKKEKKENKLNTKESNYQLKEKDKLFWFLYIFERGIESYRLLGRNKYTTEMELKVNLVEEFKNEKRILKDLKIKFSEIEENIMYSTLNIYSLQAICELKKINFFYYTDTIYYESVKFEKECLNIYFDKKNKLYKITDTIDYGEIKKKRYKIVCLKKPIKAISNYKISELYEICSLLNINIMLNDKKKLKKKELYQKIVLKIS